MYLHDARKMDFSDPPLEKAHDEQWIEKTKFVKFDLGSPMTKIPSFDTI